MHVVTVIGNRPQFIKAAAVSPHLRQRHQETLVHTGQHYDDELSSVFVRELGMSRPEHELGLGGGSNTAQTARMLARLEPLLTDPRPDAVLVYGDTNSTLAGGMAGAQLGLAVVHAEAGMRSFDRNMPEELNRVLVDHLSALLLCSSTTAVENLGRESPAGRVEMVGDVMVDVATRFGPVARERDEPLVRFGISPREYVLATAHRAGNVDDPSRLAALVELLLAVPGPVVLPLHPRTEERLRASGLHERLAASAQVHLGPPLGYLDFMALLWRARAVLTDSGGVQKEAYLARVPCVTLRDRTEWVETVHQGFNTLVDLDREAALIALDRAALPRSSNATGNPYGDGRAGERVVQALERLHDRSSA